MYKEKHKPKKCVTLFWKDDSTALMWRECQSGFISVSLQSPHPIFSLRSHLSLSWNSFVLSPSQTFSFFLKSRQQGPPWWSRVRTLPPNAGGAGLVPGQEMRSHTVWPKKTTWYWRGWESAALLTPQPFLAPSLNHHSHLFPQSYYLNVREVELLLFPYCKPFH